MGKSMLSKARSYQYYNTEKISEIFDEVVSNIKIRDSRIKYLEEENKKLKDEAYKDSELAKMKEKYESMRKDLIRGFPISEEEEKRIEEWKKKHDKEVHGITTLDHRLRAGGCIGGRYTYIFVLTSLGVVGTVKCNCGEKYEFQNDLY